VKGREPLGRAETLEILAGLLAAADAESIEAFHQDRLAPRGVSLADAATARQLLLEIVRTLEQGDPESCDRMALALDAAMPPSAGQHSAGQHSAGQRRSVLERSAAATVPAPSVDVTMPAGVAVAPSVDATLEVVAPAARPSPVQIAMPASEPEPRNTRQTSAPRGPPIEEDPLSVSVDDTVMVGHLEALQLEGGADADVAAFAESDGLPLGPTSGVRPADAEPAVGECGGPAAGDPDGSLQPLLDLDRYAVLRAWSELQPDRRSLFNRQHGLQSEEERAELDRSAVKGQHSEGAAQ